MALSKKQEVWLEEYLSTWNATEAARRAGYAHPNVEGPKNIVNPSLAEEIQRRLAEKTMSADEALVRLAEQARAEYSAYLLEDGSVDLPAMKRDGKMHLIKAIKPTKYGKAVEFHDAQTALINIGRHHQLFTDKLDVGGSLEVRENESATERILSRIDSVAARLRAQLGAAGAGANGDGAEGA